MVTRPAHFNPYEFVVLSALRAQQLLAGCTPRVAGDHSPATAAQIEVAEGHITRAAGDTPLGSRRSGWQL